MREPILDYQHMLDITEKVKEVTGLDIQMTIQPPHVDIIAALLDIIEEQAKLLENSAPKVITKADVTPEQVEEIKKEFEAIGVILNGDGHQANEEHVGDTTDTPSDGRPTEVSGTATGEPTVTTTNDNGTTTTSGTESTSPNASPAS